MSLANKLRWKMGFAVAVSSTPRTRTPRSSPAKPKPTSVAGVGGASSGTLMVPLAQLAGGTHTVLGTVLLYSAPTVAVVSGAAMLMLKSTASAMTERWQVRQARKTLEGLLRNGHTSEEHKADVRKLLEELDRSVAQAELDRVKKIKAASG